jgi:ATPase subunit of ABC transporter with duplicated ATPase domains
MTEAEWGVDELQTVGVEEMDTSQYIARPLITHKLKKALLEAGGSGRMALVGQRGSGKSTLARCLLHHVAQSHKSLKSDKATHGV